VVQPNPFQTASPSGLGSLAAANFDVPVQAQSPAAAKIVPVTLVAGAEASAFNTDAASHPGECGVGAYADFNFLPFLGLEREGRTIQFHEQENLRQDVLLGGVRYFRR
jgi:hypothetical protein